MSKIKSAFPNWYFSLGAQFFRGALMEIILTVITILMSQITLMLTFLLPLKGILLLNSPILPSFLSQEWQTIKIDYIILFFVILSAGCYGLHLLCEKWIELSTVRGTKKLLESKKKLSVSNQEKITKNIYQCYSRALSSVIFILISLFVIVLIYPFLSVLLLSYSMLVIILIQFGCYFSEKFHLMISQYLIKTISISSIVGFFLGFILIAKDLLYDPSSDIIIAIVCLILMRQIMHCIISFWKNLFSLAAKNKKIDLLLFNRKNVSALISIKQKNFWFYMDRQFRKIWIKEILHKFAGVSSENIEVKWYPAEILNVLTFEAIVMNQNNVTTEHYFLKLFNHHMHMSALHEANLLQESTAHFLPVLSFLGTTKVGNYPCHIFNGESVKPIPLKDFNEKKLQFLEKLLLYRPSSCLIESYKRSNALLHERLTPEMLLRLEYITNSPEQHQALIMLKKNFNLLIAKLEQLPLQVINPKVVYEYFCSTQTGEIKMIYWNDWRLEPLGAAWPIKTSEFDLLNPILKKACAAQPEVWAKILDTDIKLSALSFFFESFYKKQQYNHALKLVPDMLKYCLVEE